jgi:hypothetical protein
MGYGRDSRMQTVGYQETAANSPKVEIITERSSVVRVTSNIGDNAIHRSTGERKGTLYRLRNAVNLALLLGSVDTGEAVDCGRELGDEVLPRSSEAADNGDNVRDHAAKERVVKFGVGGVHQSGDDLHWMVTLPPTMSFFCSLLRPVRPSTTLLVSVTRL